MRNKLFITVALVIFNLALIAQQKEEQPKPVIYNPEANAPEELSKALEKARNENKHVLVQVGGNWCPWCIKVHKFLNENAQLDSIIKADYVFLLVNYSKENKNPDLMKKLEYPQRFGFPVFVVLDGQGRRLHTQDSGFLEKDDSYDLKKMKIFLLTWNREALKAENYLNK